MLPYSHQFSAVDYFFEEVLSEFVIELWMYCSHGITSLTTVFSMIGNSNDKYDLQFTTDNADISITSAITDSNSIDISCV